MSKIPEILDQFNSLENITKTMDVPIFRQTDVRWLSRNMQIRNTEHVHFKEARDIVRSLLKKGVVRKPI